MILFYVFAGVVTGLMLGLLIYFLFNKKKTLPEDGQSLILLQNQVQEIVRTLDNKMSESSKIMQTQFGQSAQIIKEVTEKLTKLDETNKQVISFAEQLKKLENVLTNPKQRGILGEYYLETVLKNVLPPKSYQMQYKFTNGEIVDAVIFVKDKIIPVDSKFSLENYNRILDNNNETERKK